MGVRARTTDWGGTALGPAERWPASLKHAAGFVLGSPCGMLVVWGPEHVSLYNDAFRQLLGPGGDTRQGHAAEEVLGDLWPELRDRFERVVAGGVVGPERRVLRFRREDWAYERLVTLGYGLLRDDSGDPAGVVVSTIDHTASTVAERRLRFLDRLVTELDHADPLGSAGDLLADAADDLGWSLVYARRDQHLVRVGGAGAVLDSRPEDLDPRRWPLDELDGPALILDVRDRIGDCPVADPVRAAYVVPLTDPAENGTYGMLVAGVNPGVAPDEGCLRFVRQIALQLAQAAARAESTRAERDLLGRRLGQILGPTPVGFAWTTGRDHRFAFANHRFVELLPRWPGLGRPAREASDDPTLLVEPLDQVWDRGEAVVRRAVRAVPREDGNPEADYDLLFQPVRSEDGEVEGIAAVALDVTDLALARRGAEAADRAKEDFLAMLGHELRNPLAPILTALHLMRLRGVDSAERERAIIERQVRHLLGLVDDLLDVSRITRGQLQLKRRPVELHEVVARAIETASPLLEQHHHKLTVVVSRAGLTVDADPGRLSQVVANLLTNAAKYTEPGGHITVRGGRDRGEVWLQVRDTGIGIEPRLLDRMFDLFTQEEQPLDRSQGGLGLGLAIVKSIVTLHGGTVSVTSAGSGQGSEFTVRLPAARPELEATVETGADPVPAASGPRVLIVDDNSDAAEMMAWALGMMGFRTCTAHDGPSALSAARTFQPDVALLDIGLPVMDGYELAERLRQERGLADLRVIALTGYGQEKDAARSREAGFEAHLVKPVDLDRLVALLREHPMG